MLRAAIFDFDDTLMATRLRRNDILIAALADFGYTVDFDQISAHWGERFDLLVKALAPGIPYPEFHGHYANMIARVPPRRQPGIDTLLAQLRDADILVAVVTSGSRDLVIQDLRAGGLWDSIWGLFACEDTEYHKPDPRVLSPVRDRFAGLGIGPADVCYVGDSGADHAVAVANDIRFFAVLTGSDTAADFARLGLGPNHILNTLEQCTITVLDRA